MKNNSVFIGQWCYSEPDLVPNKDGNIVLISKKSLGPLEIYEWGIDSNNIPYELYEWCENDFYENQNYCRNITGEELLKQIDSIISLFRSNGLSEWVNSYEKIYGKIISVLDMDI